MGMFVAFEGIDGCGKSTQTKLLERRLKELGKKVLLTREPGGTKVGEIIRNALFNNEIDPLTEVFLFAADRCAHINSLVKPMLDDGYIVISDRHLLSSVVYQGIAKGVGARKVLEINKYAVSNIKPNVTFVLDMPVDIALERVQNANRFESRELQGRVREGFLELSSSDYFENVILLDATGDKDTVACRVWDVFSQIYGGCI
ncbi:MAG TPA: dTMP kinase [Caldisericia bacterium]|nr:dTMP kinase [Caldisericia bacterium]HRV74615.1 dTMP kinase [Caldisericia bacterium]